MYDACKPNGMSSNQNSINSALHIQLDYTGTTKGGNTLFGDSTLRGLQASLGSLMSSSYGDTTLSSLGISRDRTGAMTLDEAKLGTALTANPDAVADLFVTKGFAAAVTTMTDAYTTSNTGILAAKTQSLTDRGKTFQTQIDAINKSADELQARLEKQFNAMEQAMSNMRAQFSQLTAILGR